MPYRRARSLIAAWDDQQLIVRNYVHRTALEMTSGVARVLGVLSSWHAFEDLCAACRELEPAAVRAILDDLVRARLVECAGTPVSDAERGLGGWSAWSTSAAFFHFDTKDVRYSDLSSAPDWRFRWALDPPPARSPLHDAVIELPEFRGADEFTGVLLSRRSWRRFGPRALTLREVSTLLGLTWGTQRWLHPQDGMRLPLKTSPSGGACHSLEVYVIARRVEGLQPGTYAYDPDMHALAPRGSAWSDEDLTSALGTQAWTIGAAATFFVTSVFDRVRWKYKSARAYRVILMEAGHFCQTFCLVATWLRLAPFCTAALADSAIEERLGVDGTSESVLYAMGVGAPPMDGRWSPWPHSDELPVTSSPAYEARLQRADPRKEKGTL